jgi:tellurite resistance-related uncharacterized protein
MFARGVDNGLQAQTRIGTAKRDVTPLNNGFPTMWMGGFSPRFTAQGVARPIYTRALAIEDGTTRRVVVSADILGFSPSLGRKIRDSVLTRFGLQDQDLLLVASHTHKGPALVEKLDPYISYGLKGFYSLDVPGRRNALVSPRALSLNGSGAHIEVPNSSSLNVTGSLTAEAWIRSTSATAQQAIVERYKTLGYTTSDGGYVLRLNSGKLQFYLLQNGERFDVLQSITTIQPNRWYHVAGVYDGATSQMRIYVDGSLDTSKTTTFTPGTGTSSVKIGAQGDNGSHTFAGLIDEVRVSAAALYVSNFVPRASLSAMLDTRGLWKFDGQSAADSSANGNNGMPVGGFDFSGDVPAGWYDGPGASSYALSLDGIGTRVEVPAPQGGPLDLTGSLTVEAWINTSNVAASQAIIERYSTSGQSYSGYALRLTQGKLQFYVIGSPGQLDFVEAIASIQPNRWYHVAGVYDSAAAQLRLFVHGSLRASKATSTAPVSGASSLKIGGRGDDGSQSGFIGLIDEARVTAGALYASSFDPNLRLNLVAEVRGLWKFDGRTSADSSATNSHGAPSGRLDEIGVVQQYSDWLAGAIVNLIGDALGRIAASPAVRLLYGEGSANFCSNRRSAGGPIDQSVPVLAIQDAGTASLLAVVFGHACHAITVTNGNLYHSDYPGVAAEALESANPGLTALFVAGAAGDVSPLPTTPENAGAQLQAAVNQVLQSGLRDTLSGGPDQTQYRVLNLPLSISPNLRALYDSVRQAGPSAHADSIVKQLDASIPLPTTLPLPIQTWRFRAAPGDTDLVIIALGGELLAGYAQIFRDSLGAGRRIWVAAYANELPGYVPTDTALTNGGYEPGRSAENPYLSQSSMVVYNWPGPLQVGLQASIMSATREMVVGTPHSLALGGTGAHVLVTNSASLNITSDLTVEAWIRTTSSAAQQAIIERYNTFGWATEDGGYALRLVSGKVQFFVLQNGERFDVLQSKATLSAHTWYHVAGVYESASGQVRLYVNGEQDTSKASAYAPGTGTSTIKIGAQGDNAANTFAGLIDEARISASALYSTTFVPPASLTSAAATRGLWKFDGESAADYSAFGNTGSLVGGATFSTEVPQGGGPNPNVTSTPCDIRACVGAEEAMAPPSKLEMRQDLTDAFAPAFSLARSGLTRVENADAIAYRADRRQTAQTIRERGITALRIGIPSVTSVPLADRVSSQRGVSPLLNSGRSGPPTEVEIQIYDLAGRRVRVAFREALEPGHYRYDWDGKDDVGRQLAPGVYIAVVRAAGQTSRSKLVLTR